MNAVSLCGLAAVCCLVMRSCPFLTPTATEPPPLQGEPTRENLIGAINANTAKIRTLETDSVSLSVQGMPISLRGDLAVERPRRFRLRTSVIGFSGPDLDLGSNDDVFWVWSKWNQPPAVYYARHADFYKSAARRFVPVEPERLIEALGLVQIDPAGRNEGPFPRDEGRFELRSTFVGTDGELTRVLIVDANYGQVLEQHLYDSARRPLVHIRSSGHRYYPEPGVSLPTQIEIQMPGGPTLRLDVPHYAINRLGGDPQQLWSMPRVPQAEVIDLASPRAMEALSGGLGTRKATPAPPVYGPPASAERPRYRGYTAPR